MTVRQLLWGAVILMLIMSGVLIGVWPTVFGALPPVLGAIVPFGESSRGSNSWRGRLVGFVLVAVAVGLFLTTQLVEGLAKAEASRCFVLYAASCLGFALMRIGARLNGGPEQEDARAEVKG